MGQLDIALTHATLADVPQLARISALSFKHDPHTQMKATAQGPASFEAGMAVGLDQWIQAKDRCVVLKAVRIPEGTIVGFISWGFRGMRVGAVAESTFKILYTEGSTGGSNPATVSQPPQSEGAEKVGSLERMTSEHLAGFQKRVMPEGTRCMYIGAVSVDPRYHGVGIGSRLVKWGTDQADRAGVFCWVHSSEAGWRTFSKHGFEEVERLTVDLDQWAPRPPSEAEVGTGEAADETGQRRVWGDYTFRYMIRQPATELPESRTRAMGVGGGSINN